MAEFYQCKLIGIRPKERMTFRNAAKDIMTFSILIFVSILIAAADAFSSPKLPQIESFSVTNSPQHNNNNNDNNNAVLSIHTPSMRKSCSQITLFAATKSSTTTTKTVMGPPPETKPDYASIHGPLGPLADRLFLTIFRLKMASRLANDNGNNSNNSNATTTAKTPHSDLPLDDFQGIIELTSQMNSHYRNRTHVQQIAQQVLVSLFPPFILDRYPTWFARPFPEFSAKMCAWATVVGGTWLMGECVVNDIPEEELEKVVYSTADDRGGERRRSNNTRKSNTWGKNQGVLVKRCRFLEESQCASICINSCKIPTQNFFRENMGLPLTMTPNYETGECQFSFGRVPTEEEERLARDTPCLRRCPSGGGMRSWHDGKLYDDYGGDGKWLEDLKALAEETKKPTKSEEAMISTCILMED
mmetsp:Transcript_13382/g.27335  ORF Transcript_13382/g.27335 Transcript_13382/m.27335 type:complete len:416 (+) Transcript_13382:151-1398(+)